MNAPSFIRYYPPSPGALKPILDRFAELLSLDLSLDECAHRMNVSNAQCCVYLRLIRERLGSQAR